MPPRSVLIFGGTTEARELADRLVDDGFEVVTALAGVTQDPMLPRGEVHRGRLGGVEGIVAYSRQKQFDVFIDATHPFAAKISANLATAAQQLALPCVRLERQAWQTEAGDQWTEVSSIESAAAAIPRHARVLLTIGQRGLEHFIARSDLTGVVRTIEPLSQPIPANWRLLQKRPPYLVEDERELLAAEQITALVTKNSGGEATAAKLIAARERKIPVVMIARPRKPAMPSFRNLATLVEALKA